MNNVENKNSPKMIIGFVFGLFAGVIGVLFAKYVVGVDEPEKNTITQQSEKALNNPNQLEKTSRLSIANTGSGKNTLPEKSEEEHKLILSLEEELLQARELDYRVVDVCAGDLGS